MYSQPNLGNAGPQNQVFESDEQTQLKLRQKFKCKKALHWFMVNKAVSTSTSPFCFWGCSYLNYILFRTSFYHSRRIVLSDSCIKFSEARNLFFGIGRSLPWKSLNGRSSPSLICGNKSKMFLSSSHMYQTPGNLKATGNQKRNTSLPWSQLCIRSGSVRQLSTVLNKDTQIRKPPSTNPRNSSLPVSGPRSSSKSLTSLVSFLTCSTVVGLITPFNLNSWIWPISFL